VQATSPAPAAFAASAQPTPGAMSDYVFQVGAFKDADSVDGLRQRLEGRGLRTRMERSGKLYVVLVLLRGDQARAAEVVHTAESMGLGKPIQRSRKPVPRTRAFHLALAFSAVRIPINSGTAIFQRN